jgi:hypothetical protein
VSVKRRNGALYTTSFYACSGCLMMFLNPQQFNSLGDAAPNVEMPRAVSLGAAEIVAPEEGGGAECKLRDKRSGERRS